MSDEVKQAAERLLEMRCRHDAGDAFAETYVYWPDPAVPPSHDKLSDLYIVAMAYLRDHSNDAENVTLLTADILQASGWVPSVAGTIWDHQMTRMQLRVDVNNWHVSVCGVRIGTVETVGDLRKLLEALHVPEVVVVPKGGE